MTLSNSIQTRFVNHIKHLKNQLKLDAIALAMQNGSIYGVIIVSAGLVASSYMNPLSVDAQSVDSVPALQNNNEEFSEPREIEVRQPEEPEPEPSDQRSQSLRILGSLLNAALNQSRSITVDLEMLDDGFAGSVSTSNQADQSCTLGTVNAERQTNGGLRLRFNTGDRTASCNAPGFGLSLDAVPGEDTTTIQGSYSIEGEQPGRFNATIDRPTSD